jgi:L-fucose isomerase-like protein
MEIRRPRAGFVGFGEVNSPRALIERKCRAAADALRDRGIDLVWTDPVSDDPAGIAEARAREELAKEDFDVLVVCIAGWIPSHSVFDVISPFAHRPMVLWGLTGEYEEGRLVTTADQAGTTALRAPMEALGFRFTYVFDTPDAPFAAAGRVAQSCEVARAIALLRESRVGMVGYRDMKLHSTLLDGLSLRARLGPEVEVVDTLEVAQLMERADPAEVGRIAAEIRRDWQFDREASDEVLDRPIRLFLAVMEKVRERGYGAVSIIDVDGVKKLMGFTPAAANMLLADRGGVATIPENDGLGSVTQLIVRFLTGQAGAYFEFYEFMPDRVLIGVPDYVPAEVTEGGVRVMLAKFGELSEGVLNVSRVRTGTVTLCRLGSKGDRYWMHVVMGEAVTPSPWEEAGWERPAPQLPSLEVILDSPVDDFAQKVLGQHYILAYGDQRDRLHEFCRLLGIDAA